MGQVATTIQHSNSPPQTPLSLFAPSGLRITALPTCQGSSLVLLFF
ncbi:MAG: hypothetical protein HYW48_11940 [Deltaproteobacteria bacterium]|nr:hypothetical protein [Deltaproteobacteria bacterium]